MDDITLIIGIIGLVTSILSVIISLWVFRRARPLYYLQLVKLDGVNHPDINISFGNRQVSNLYSVRIVFWNWSYYILVDTRLRYRLRLPI